MVFTGIYEHTIDAKNRLAIPAEVRTALGRTGKGKSTEAVGLYVTLGDDHRSLALFTKQEFENRAADLDESELDADEVLAFEEMFYAHARQVEMDGQGRIRLPETLLKLSGLGGEVVIIGARNMLRIRDRDQWQALREKTLAENPDILANPRRLMRRKKKDSNNSKESDGSQD